MSWAVFKSIRAFAGSIDGIGALEEGDGEPHTTGPGTVGRFTLAHETGHIYSLPDEYVETQTFASGGAPSIVGFSPGSAYILARPDMMISEVNVTPRYYWHAAEWLHSLNLSHFRSW